MVYAYDQWALLPVKDIYDTLMMLATINAAKDMYEKGAKQIEDFRKDYLNFTTAVPGQLERYNNIINGVFKGIDDMYNRGIDPLRSQEGRARTMQLINSLPYDELGRIKAGAKAKEEFDKNVAKLQSAGLYDPDFAAWQLRGWLPFDEQGRANQWTATALVPYQGLQGLTENYVKNIKPHVLSKEEAIAKVGEEYNPKLQYTGVTEQDLRNALQDLSGLNGMPEYEYWKLKLGDRLVDTAIDQHIARTTPFDYQVDPIYDLSTRRSRGGGRGSGSGYNQDGEYLDYDWSDDLFMGSVANILDDNIDNYDADSWGSRFDDAYARKSAFVHSPNDFIKKFAIENSVTNDQLATYLEKEKNQDGTIITSSSDRFLTDSALYGKSKFGSGANQYVKNHTNGRSTGRTIGFKNKEDRFVIYGEYNLYDDNDKFVGRGWRKLSGLDSDPFKSVDKKSHAIYPSERSARSRYFGSTKVNKTWGAKNAETMNVPFYKNNTNE